MAVLKPFSLYIIEGVEIMRNKRKIFIHMAENDEQIDNYNEKLTKLIVKILMNLEEKSDLRIDKN